MPADFISYWAALVVKNPRMRDSEAKLTITVAALRQALDRAYQHGTADGIAVQKALETSEQKPQGLFDSLFDSLKNPWTT